MKEYIEAMKSEAITQEHKEALEQEHKQEAYLGSL